jgi:hypothetical protein
MQVSNRLSMLESGRYVAIKNLIHKFIFPLAQIATFIVVVAAAES